MLEVNSLLPAGQVGAGQISRTTNEVRDDLGQGGQDTLRQLAGSDSSVGGREAGQGLLPVLGQLASKTAGQLSGLLGELLGVLLEELVPGSLGLGTVSSTGTVVLVDLIE